MNPLDGITVVSLEQAVAAPFATRQLADLGARVIKVERPGAGDFARGYDETVNGLASHFVWLNRSKESVALDLKSDLGREAVRALAARADVCRALERELDPAPELSQLRLELDHAYHEVGHHLDTNDALWLTQEAGQTRVHLAAPDALTEPPSLKVLRAEVSARLPVIAHWPRQSPPR